jgi:hypothetical protein
MGFFSRWKEEKRQQFKAGTAPYVEARNQVWREEQERIGKEEFDRRYSAVMQAKIGQGPLSGFEDWYRALDMEVQVRAHQIADSRS